MTEPFWNETRTETLKLMIKDGATAQSIANHLGCTRASAIGKADRMYLRFGTSLPRGRKVSAKSDDKDLAISFKACQWPIGDRPTDPDFHFCGDNAIAGKPYCETHCNVAYRRPASNGTKPVFILNTELT